MVKGGAPAFGRAPQSGNVMSALTIVQYPDPVLRRKAARVERVTPELRDFALQMGDTMHASNGVGLAAPQVGIALRIIVVDVEDRLQVLFNPQILTAEGHQTGTEGCLSFPGLHGEVTRAQRVTVTGHNARGKKITLSGEDLWARAMQHEIDHLDGILFIDRAREDSLYWATGEVDEDNNFLTRPTNREEIERFFERQAALLRA